MARRFLYDGCSIADGLGSSPVLVLTTNSLISLYYANCTEDGVECCKQIATGRAIPPLTWRDRWGYGLAVSSYVNSIPVKPTSLIVATALPYLTFSVLPDYPMVQVIMRAYEHGGKRACEHIMDCWERPVRWKSRCIGLTTFWTGSVRSRRLSILTICAPRDPVGSEHEPGTEGKVAVMEKRAGREIALFSPWDVLKPEELEAVNV